MTAERVVPVEPTELLPCPFCGGEARYASSNVGPGYHWHVCSVCGRETSACWTEADAINHWNRRAPTPSDGGEPVAWLQLIYELEHPDECRVGWQDNADLMREAARELRRLYAHPSPGPAVDREAVAEAFRKGAMAALGCRPWENADDFFTLVGAAYADGEPFPSTMPRPVLSAAPPPSVGEGVRERVARCIRENVRVDATGLAPAVASVFIVGVEDAADAILAALQPQAQGGE